MSGAIYSTFTHARFCALSRAFPSSPPVPHPARTVQRDDC